MATADRAESQPQTRSERRGGTELRGDGRRPGDELAAAVEAETQTVGRELWERLERRSPSIFERRWWDDRILSWAMSDESVKVQMFRFVDVLPMLRSHTAVMRHLQEYFDEVRRDLPWAVRIALDVSQPNSLLGRLVAINARSNARRMARRFIAGANVEDVMASVAKLRKQGLAFTLDLLGEAVVSEREADAYAQQYLNLITGLAAGVNQWPELAQIDRDQFGPIPRINVSLKLSALYSRFKPIDPEGSAEGVKQRLRPLLRAARKHDAYVHVDMEHHAYKDLTLDIFKQVFLEDEFRSYPDCGIVLQTYLPDAGRDLEDLLAWVKERGTPVWVRLVKGAYWDYETVVAASHGWPVPVYQQKWQSDDNFERQTRFLMQNHQWLRPALGSHNLRSLAHGIAWARVLEIPPDAWEIQMLYGMGAEMAQLFAEMGHRVRIYTPFGELIPGMAYLVRRLLENTSNDSFLRLGFTEQVSIEELMMKPDSRGATGGSTARAAKDDAMMPHTGGQAASGTPRDVGEADRSDCGSPPFSNEPHSDFSRVNARQAMQTAVDEVARRLGGEYPLVIDGREVDGEETIVSLNPSHKQQVVGTVAAAAVEQAEEAIAAARRAFPKWSREKPEYRCEYLELIAAEMRNRRDELAAWQVHECGKPWPEADADVAEAIDFCNFYADEMRRMAEPRQCDVPGEENSYFYRPRGVAVVIAPWNFPLAILTGMTAAAMVTGNTVVMKPAEQSPVVAWQLMEIARHVGLPDGVLNYLPGVGEEVGPALVSSPDVEIIAFTGSRTVGLEIYRQASDTDPRQRMVKQVIAEMGGKNALIVDSDADLDEAVAGVVSSAFGYAGQKCSACSRAIVLADAYDAFVERLVQATQSQSLGPAEAPGTTIGPVIDQDAFERIHEYIEAGGDEAELLLAGDVGGLAGEGWYVGPHIFGNVRPTARIAQEEIFGPVLSVIKARHLDEAFEIANGTDYALTAGIFTRSPANLRRARTELIAGNIYLNRSITGALVQRQPFGGYKMSGVGSKAGGPDYLQQFVVPVNVTENTMRRGFAPPPDPDG